MKGDIGMSCHEKEREQEDKVIYNPIPTSLFCNQNVACLLNGMKKTAQNNMVKC